MRDIDGVEIDDLDLDDLDIDEINTKDEVPKEQVNDLILDDTEETSVPETVREIEETAITDEESDPYDGYEDDEDDEEDRLKINPLKIALVILVMVLLAAAITVVVWDYRNPNNTVKQVLSKRPAISAESLLPEYMTEIEYPSEEARKESKAFTGDETETEDEEEVVASSAEAVAADASDKIKTKDGHFVIFREHDDYVTAKEYVNMRTEPSTTQAEATVAGRLEFGTVVHRTGISSDGTWSRVEKDSQILYVASSYLVNAEQTE